MKSPERIPYPRNIFQRNVVRIAGKLLLPLLARPVIKGIKNLPAKGPVILAGNHVAIMEIVMMAVYSPYQVEFIGTGDIPIDPNFAGLANFYGFIPIQRGNIDRDGVKAAVDVLNQNGVIGIFPQGGIWDTTVNQARIGVAMLSHLAKAPIVPIGFGGMQGALKMIGQLKRPKLIMNIGEMIPPVDISPEKGSRREILEKAANQVLERIVSLMPAEERITKNTRQNESFGVAIEVFSDDGAVIPLPINVDAAHFEALGRFFHYPILLDALKRNLHLPVEDLENLDKKPDPHKIQAACQTILDYLKINPGFFTYRFGMDMGIAIANGLNDLADLAKWCDSKRYTLKITPVYSYTDPATGEIFVEKGQTSAHKM